jgi:hypothetical protein
MSIWRGFPSSVTSFKRILICAKMMLKRKLVFNSYSDLLESSNLLLAVVIRHTFAPSLMIQLPNYKLLGKFYLVPTMNIGLQPWLINIILLKIIPKISSDHIWVAGYFRQPLTYP